MAKQEARIGQFFVQVNKQDIPLNVMSQLDDAIVEDDLARPAMFVLRFNDSQLSLLDGELFRIGAEVRLGAAGVDGKSATLLVGEVTSIEPSLVQHNLTLTVRGYDRSHRLHRGQRIRTFVNKTDDDIVRQIAREAQLRVDIEPVGVLHRYLIQHNQTDMEFLQARAAALGYRVAVRDDTLLFRPVEHQPPEAPVLDFGTNLLEFRARLSAVAQPAEVTVRGWDPLAKRAIRGRRNRPTNPPAINGRKTAAQVAQQAFGTPAALVVGDRPVASQDEAERMAASILDRAAGDYLAAEGMCLGVTQLRAGARVRVKSVGERMSGAYLVTATRHEYTAGGGYTTTFFVSGRSPSGLLEQVSPAEPVRERISGVAVGIVTNVEDPEKLGRVRLRFPWLDDDHESEWARLALAWGGPKRGIFGALAVDDEVLVAFEHGDINRPFVVGALWNGKDRPPEEAVKAGRNLALAKTAAGLTLALDDVADSITLTAGKHSVALERKGHTVTITAGDARVTLDSSSKQISVATKGDVVIEGAGGALKISQSGVELTSQGKLSVSANQMLDVSSKAVVSVSGSLVKINS